jgi:hypothetical protein
MNAEELQKEVDAGKAAITFAVAQFSDNPKLAAFKEDKDLVKLLESLDEEEDPFILKEMPPIGGVRQFLLFSKETKLPFGEKGVIQKQGNEEIAKHIVREQLEVYAKEYPWTRPMIEQGLKKAGTNCKGCSEKHLLQKVAQAVKDQLDNQGSAPTLEEMAADDTDPTMWGAREPCPLCTLKHLSQAIVLFNESLTGYPVHRWYAIGHVAEAEAESPSQDMANRIRFIRITAMDDIDFIPDFTDIITELDAIVRGNIAPESPDH